MQRTFLYAAYGYLCFAGVLHFIIDVMSQYFRGQRTPSSETTLYYGLHSAYSLSQVLFAAMALLIIRSGSDLMSQNVSFALSFLATAAWLAICFAFIEYTPPKINMAIVFALLLAAVATR